MDTPALGSEQTQPYQPRLAGKGRRFLTFLVDYVAYLALSFLAGIVAVLVAGEAAAAIFEGWRAYVFSFLLYFAYYMVLEGTTGRTLGKLVAGTLVVDEEGRRPTLGQIAGRTAARLVPFEPFSVLLDDEGWGWHDRWAETCVIQIRGVAPSMQPGYFSKVLRHRLEEGASLDTALGELRAAGASIIETIRSVRTVYDCDLAEARQRVQTSAAWADFIATRNEEFQKALEELAREDASR